MGDRASDSHAYVDEYEVLCHPIQSHAYADDAHRVRGGGYAPFPHGYAHAFRSGEVLPPPPAISIEAIQKAVLGAFLQQPEGYKLHQQKARLKSMLLFVP